MSRWLAVITPARCHSSNRCSVFIGLPTTPTLVRRHRSQKVIGATNPIYQAAVGFRQASQGRVAIYPAVTIDGYGLVCAQGIQNSQWPSFSVKLLNSKKVRFGRSMTRTSGENHANMRWHDTEISATVCACVAYSRTVRAVYDRPLFDDQEKRAVIDQSWTN
jgi:hypothetical protein